MRALVKGPVELESYRAPPSEERRELAEYLSFREGGKLPMYRIDTEGAAPRYIFTDKEWKKFKPDYMARRKAELAAEAKLRGEEPPEVTEDDLGPDVKPLGEIVKLEAAVKKLEEAGFDIQPDEKESKSADAPGSLPHPFRRERQGRADAG